MKMNIYPDCSILQSFWIAPCCELDATSVFIIFGQGHYSAQLNTVEYLTSEELLYSKYNEHVGDKF